jgi:[FeFe] hydrogenase H-cluster maturation GTPase HydF
MLNKTDIAILVVDASVGMTAEDERILNRIKDKEIPHTIVMNKSDLLNNTVAPASDTLFVSAVNNKGIFELKQKLGTLIPQEDKSKTIVGDLINPMDFIVLVIPVDKAAPKGRLILPQQQTIRDILDHNAVSIVVKDSDLKDTLNKLGQKPALVITDSQVFAKVSKDVPEDVPLTSFSILFARYKGDLKTVVHGARTLDTLNDGDTILISEGCTHHR